jgi:hypothetical protein
MENVIFQFLKILFWDKSAKNYKINIMRNTIKDEHIEKIIYFFLNIKNERTNEYPDLQLFRDEIEKFRDKTPVNCLFRLCIFYPAEMVVILKPLNPSK